MENGRLTVDAKIPNTDVQATLEIERAAGLSGDKMEYWENWISEGAILTPIAEAELAEEDTSDEEKMDWEDDEQPSNSDDSSITEEESPFAAVEEASDEEEAFDFSAFSEGGEEETDEQDVEQSEFLPQESAADETDNMFDGLVTEDSEAQESLGTDDSGLADFLKDLE